MLVILLVNALLLHGHHHHHHHEEEIVAQEESVAIYHVEGMNCNHCRANAENALRSVEGVEDAQVDLATKEARIKGNPKVEDLKKAVEDLGFTFVS